MLKGAAYNFLCGVFGSDLVMSKQELANHDTPDTEDGRHEAGYLRGRTHVAFPIDGGDGQECDICGQNHSSLQNSRQWRSKLLGGGLTIRQSSCHSVWILLKNFLHLKRKASSMHRLQARGDSSSLVVTNDKIRIHRIQRYEVSVPSHRSQGHKCAITSEMYLRREE